MANVFLALISQYRHPCRQIPSLLKLLAQSWPPKNPRSIIYRLQTTRRAAVEDDQTQLTSRDERCRWIASEHTAMSTSHRMGPGSRTFARPRDQALPCFFGLGPCGRRSLTRQLCPPRQVHSVPRPPQERRRTIHPIDKASEQRVILNFRFCRSKSSSRFCSLRAEPDLLGGGGDRRCGAERGAKRRRAEADHELNSHQASVPRAVW